MMKFKKGDRAKVYCETDMRFYTGNIIEVDSEGFYVFDPDGKLQYWTLPEDRLQPEVPETKDTNPKDAIGIKKVCFSVLPWRVLYGVALAMMEGAAKYGRHNYRAAGVRASVYFDATVARHIGPWWEGEDIDPDSGKHHIEKAIASLMVLRDSMLQGNFVDDRPPRGYVDLVQLNNDAATILAQHADKNPKHYTIEDNI